jgi:hypothetical protein
MEIVESRSKHYGLIRTINEVLEAFWAHQITKVIHEVLHPAWIIHYTFIKVINEELNPSWTFALKKVISEWFEVREGPLTEDVKLTVIVADAVSAVESLLGLVAEKVVYVIGEVEVAYDSLTRIVAKGLKGMTVVVNEAVATVESFFKKIAKNRRITHWKHRHHGR